MIKFKILDTTTGLYSDGEYTPTWSDRGKSWDSWKNVISHLNKYRIRLKRGNKIPTSWAVVELKVTLTEINRTSVKDLPVKPELPIALHVSGKDICRKNLKRSKYKSQKKTGKRSKE
jgi:hypothetical protein